MTKKEERKNDEERKKKEERKNDEIIKIKKENIGQN